MAPRLSPRALLAACTLPLALLIAAPAADAAPMPLVTGISGLEDSSTASFEQAKATGASFVRIAVPWGGVAPSSPPPAWEPESPTDPNYDWSAVDAAVSGAVAFGLTPLLQVDGAPRWAQRCVPPSYASGATCDPDPAALAAFATAAARRFSGAYPGIPAVRYWQGLNEPNLSHFFDPQFVAGRATSADLYRTLANAFYAAITSVSHSNVVLLGGLGPIAVPRYTIGPMRFARELLCMTGRRHPRPAPGAVCRGGVHFDVFDIHPYTTGGPTHRGRADDVELGDLPKLQRLLAAADRAGRIKGRYRRTPLWVTEFGWDSDPPDPGGLSMGILSRWAAEALYRSWRAGVSHFFWYPLRDAPEGHAWSETVQSGLYFRGPTVAGDTPKEVLLAFRFPFVAYPRRDGLLYWGRTPDSHPGRVLVQTLVQGRWRTATSIRAGKGGMFSGVAPTSYGAARRGYARALFRGEAAVAFSMHPVKDFRQEPFG